MRYSGDELANPPIFTADGGFQEIFQILARFFVQSAIYLYEGASPRAGQLPAHLEINLPAPNNKLPRANTACHISAANIASPNPITIYTSTA